MVELFAPQQPSESLALDAQLIFAEMGMLKRGVEFIGLPNALGKYRLEFGKWSGVFPVGEAYPYGVHTP